MTGAIALYKARFPAATAQQIKAALLASAVPTASLRLGQTRTGGRLDVWAMLVVRPSTACSVSCPAGQYCLRTAYWEDACARW